MVHTIRKILEKHNLDYCFSGEDKKPLLPSDEKIGQGGRFSENVKCSEKTKEGKHIAICLKENGTKINGEYLVCIDIDAKYQYGNTEEIQNELLEKVKNTLQLEKRYPYIEKTLNGGFHIWLKCKEEDFKLIGNKRIIIATNYNNKKERMEVIREIEVFTSKRFVMLYKEIDFSDLDSITFKDIDFLHSLQEEKVEKIDNYEDSEEISRTSNSSLLKKAKINIPEIKLFSEGEWAGYNTVKNEIMRFYITLNMENDFIETIKSYHSKHSKEWERFPANYLKNSNGNRKPSKNTKHIEWLKEIGYFKSLKPTKEDKIKTSDLESLYKSAIVINESAVFLWDGKSYRVADPEGTKNKICERLESKGIYTNEDLLNEAYMRVYRLASIYSENYNFEADKTFMNKVAITFNNGTLYLTREKSIFKINEFLKENRCFTHFTVDYDDSIWIKKDDSIIREWIDNKFSTEEEKHFFKMCLGDLFVTANNSELMPYFYGDAGVGKSVLLKSLENILKPGSVSALSVNEFNNRFSKIALMKSSINFSSEISKRSINTDIFKKIISREPMEMEYKGINGVMGKPLSKHIAIANSLPEVDIDGGVERRFAIIELKHGKIRTHLDSNEFKFLVFEDYKSLIAVIIEGIMGLFSINFDLRSYYEKKIDKKYKQEFIVKNNQIAHFVDTVFDRGETFNGYTTTEIMRFFECFRTTYAGAGISQMKLTTLGARLVESGLKRKSKRVGDKVVKMFDGLKIKEEWLEIFKNGDKKIDEFEETYSVDEAISFFSEGGEII